MVDRKGKKFWNPIEWRCIDTLWSSKADMVLIQMQDLLGLGSEARMNTPSTVGINWKWRLKEKDITEDIKNRLKEVTTTFNR